MYLSTRKTKKHISQSVTNRCFLVMCPFLPYCSVTLLVEFSGFQRRGHQGLRNSTAGRKTTPPQVKQSAQLTQPIFKPVGAAIIRDYSTYLHLP